MWLPTDERKLLAGYYRMGCRDDDRAYCEHALAGLLHGKKRVVEYGDDQEEPQPSRTPKQLQVAIAKVVTDQERVKRANEQLAERGYIKLERHSSEISVVIVRLTLGGYDLGRKYASWWICSGLWWQEQKGHWFWLLVVFLTGLGVRPLFERFLQASGSLAW